MNENAQCVYPAQVGEIRVWGGGFVTGKARSREYRRFLGSLGCFSQFRRIVLAAGARHQDRKGNDETGYASAPKLFVSVAHWIELHPLT